MKERDQKPKKFYKYKSSFEESVDLLWSAQVYCASPDQLNDPLECKPEVQFDIDYPKLKEIISACYSRKKATQIFENAKYFASQYGSDKQEVLRLLCSEVEKIVFNEFNQQGIFSMSSTWKSPLMWSHYANGHRGVCLELTGVDPDLAVKEVKYQNEKLTILCSDIYSWLVKKKCESYDKIYKSFFLAKLKHWKYEKESRYVSSEKGTQSSPFRISAIYFGSRCEPYFWQTFVKLFKEKEEIEFYFVRQDGVKLSKEKLTDEDIRGCDVPSMSPYEAFAGIYNRTPSDGDVLDQRKTRSISLSASSGQAPEFLL